MEIRFVTEKDKFEMFFYGKSVPMGGIASVATLPEYRHCHCASNMLIKALEIMKERGQIFSALTPFSFPFYRKYSWELGFHTREYHLLMSGLKGFGKGDGEFRPLFYEDIENIAKVYTAFMQPYNGISQMLLGYIGIKQAVETGKTEIRNSSLFELINHVFKCGTTFVNDYY